MLECNFSKPTENFWHVTLEMSWRKITPQNRQSTSNSSNGSEWTIFRQILELAL